MSSLKRRASTRLFQTYATLVGAAVIAAGVFAARQTHKSEIYSAVDAAYIGYLVAGAGVLLLLLSLADGLRRLARRRHHIALRVALIAIYLAVSLRICPAGRDSFVGAELVSSVPNTGTRSAPVGQISTNAAPAAAAARPWDKSLDGASRASDENCALRMRHAHAGLISAMNLPYSHPTKGETDSVRQPCEYSHELLFLATRLRKAWLRMRRHLRRCLQGSSAFWQAPSTTATSSSA